MKPPARLILVGVAVLGMLGCRSSAYQARTTGDPLASHGRVTVLAAASLKDAFEELKPVFEKAYPGQQLVFSFAGSNECATQIEHGARAEVFASADQRHMDELERKGLVLQRRNFVNNLLCVAVRSDAQPALTRFEDLARAGLRLVAAADEVPAGRYTNQALRCIEQRKLCGEGCVGKIRKNIVSKEPNVRLAVTKISLGVADAAFCYRSDITPPLRSRLKMIPLPAEAQVAAEYPIAVLRQGRNQAGARAFVEFVISPEAQAVFARHGFLPVRGSGSGAGKEGR